MSKFCANCGFQMEDSDKVCGNCGTPVAAISSAPRVATSPIDKKISASKFDFKEFFTKYKKIIMIALIAVVAIVVIVGISIINSLTGYQRVLDRCAKAIKNNDAEAAVAELSSIYSYRDEDELVRWIDNEINSILDAAEDKVGTVKSVSIEVVDEKDISERKTEKFIEYVEDRFDVEMRGLKSIKEVKYRIIVEGSKNTYKTSKLTGYLFKEDGGWKIYLGTLYQ